MTTYTAEWKNLKENLSGHLLQIGFMRQVTAIKMLGISDKK